MNPALQDGPVTVFHGDALDVLREMPDESVHMVLTSPPYWSLRDYNEPGQLGLEETPDLYVENMVRLFREVRRVLRHDGTCWLNLGDSYAGSSQTGRDGRTSTLNAKRSDDGRVVGHSNVMMDRPTRAVAPGLKPKDLVMMPARVAMALQADGWVLRSDIIWAKPNPMPESVTDRPTTSHEHVFLLTRSPRYFYDADAVREAVVNPDRIEDGRRDYPSQLGGRQPGNTVDRGGYLSPNPAGRNLRSVWQIATQPYSEAHFATMPEALCIRPIKAGCPEGGIVLDPFAGSGTTLAVARRLGRRAIGIELSQSYIDTLIRPRISGAALPLLEWLQEAGG